VINGIEGAAEEMVMWIFRLNIAADGNLWTFPKLFR
jgi:hypothetical protein